MNTETLHNVFFPLHRYLGLIVGLTGSLLVFQHEINHFLVEQQFGRVVSHNQRLPVESILEYVAN